MPSSNGYKRDYKREYALQKKRGDVGPGSPNAIRKKARKKAIAAGMISPHSKLEIDHKKPLAKGGAGLAMSNLRAVPRSKNRSFKRTAGAGMA